MPPLLENILVEHFEELLFLWSRRCRECFSPLHTPASFAGLDARIEAHVEGLLLAGSRLLDLFGHGLDSDDSGIAFAAAYPLLRLGRADLAGRVLDAFQRAEAGGLPGLLQALCNGPVAPILRPLRVAARSTEPRTALTAMEVLAFQSPSDCDLGLLERFLFQGSTDVRRQGWRVVSLLKDTLPPASYKRALEDDDPQVRREAFWAAAWGRQSWLLNRCRALTRSSDRGEVDALRLLATLGRPEDLGVIRDPRWVEHLGATWFEVLGSSGHPGVIPDLIQGMEHPNPRLAVAAGTAFTKVTGCDVTSKTRVQLPPEDGHVPDEFEKEFLDEAFLPDPDRAREFWMKHKGKYLDGLRWCRGQELSREVTRDVLESLDLESRREAYLSAASDARWGIGLVDLERFPQDPVDSVQSTGFAPARRGTGCATAKWRPSRGHKGVRLNRTRAFTLAYYPSLIETHAEDCVFLWVLRDRAIGQPHYQLSQLADLDDRVEAHLDGLRVASDYGWGLIETSLTESGGPGALFAAGVLAFGSDDQGRVQEVLKVGTATPGAERGVISALGWLPYEKASAPIKDLLASEIPGYRRIGLAASAAHRRNPGPAIQAAFLSEDPRLRARAFRVAGELGLIPLVPALKAHIRSDDPACRFWAAWSAALLHGDRDALLVLQSLVEGESPFDERAVSLAVRRLPVHAAKALITKLATIPAKARLTVVGIGALGDPEFVPRLIEQMKLPALARVAGEAFSLITGVDITSQNLEARKPEGSAAAPTESPADGNAGAERDEDLPWPNVDAIKSWWKARQAEFARGTRYVLGQPLGPGPLQNALRNAFQRQRAAAALEAAILHPGKPLFEVRAPGFRQREALATPPRGR